MDRKKNLDLFLGKTAKVKRKVLRKRDVFVA